MTSMVKLLVVLFGIVNAAPKLTQDMISTLQSLNISEKGIDILKRYSENGCPPTCRNAFQLADIFGLNSTNNREMDKIRKEMWREFHTDKCQQQFEGDLAVIVDNFIAGFVNSAKEFCCTEKRTSRENVGFAQRNTQEEKIREKERQAKDEENFRRVQKAQKAQDELEEDERQFNQEKKRKKKERKRKKQEDELRRRQEEQNNQQSSSSSSKSPCQAFIEERQKQENEEIVNEKKRLEEKMKTRQLEEEKKKKKEQQRREEDEILEQIRIQWDLERKAQRLAEDKAIHEAGEQAREETKRKQEELDTSGAEPNLMTKFATIVITILT